MSRDTPVCIDHAYETQDRIRPLVQIVYRFGKPSSDAHQRMKCAMTLMGKLPSMRTRHPLSKAELERIGDELSETSSTLVGDYEQAVVG